MLALEVCIRTVCNTCFPLRVVQPMPSCEPHWLRSGLRCNFAFNLNSLDDILSLQVHAEGPNQPLESYAIDNIETMIGLANIPAYEPHFLNVGVQSSHPIRGIRP